MVPEALFWYRRTPGSLGKSTSKVIRHAWLPFAACYLRAEPAAALYLWHPPVCETNHGVLHCWKGPVLEEDSAALHGLGGRSFAARPSASPQPGAGCYPAAWRARCDGACGTGGLVGPGRWWWDGHTSHCIPSQPRFEAIRPSPADGRSWTECYLVVLPLLLASYLFRFLQLRRHKARCHLLDPVSGVAAAHDGDELQLPPNLVQNPGFDRILPSDSQRADEWSFHGQGYSLIKVRDGFGTRLPATARLSSAPRASRLAGQPIHLLRGLTDMPDGCPSSPNITQADPGCIDPVVNPDGDSAPCDRRLRLSNPSHGGSEQVWCGKAGKISLSHP